jgi:hypothetical protein
MRELNRTYNQAGEWTLKLCEDLMNHDKYMNRYLIGVEMGIAYGGGVEKIGKLWQNRGVVYGFDTFEDLMPKIIDNKEVNDMDDAYIKFGMQGLSLKYQQGELDRQGLDNVKLVKGLITKDSCKDLPYIDYCLLDLDVLESMKIGYEAVKDKTIYLCLHDIYFYPRLSRWFETIIKDWSIIAVHPVDDLIILKKL